MLFENAFQKLQYKVVGDDHGNYDFTIAYFPLMNPHDSVVLVQIMTKHIDKEILNSATYNLALEHVKEFLMFYYWQMDFSNFELAKEFKKFVPKPNT